MRHSCFPFGPGRVVLLGLALFVVFGCRGQPPAPADPERAREVLRQALDAWQRGDTPESLKQRDPAIVANDPEWSSGTRLLNYKVDGDGLLGAELRCPVTLSVQTKNGKTVQKKAVYYIGTTPVLTVVREEEQ
jgi:hypothetical protein